MPNMQKTPGSAIVLCLLCIAAVALAAEMPTGNELKVYGWSADEKYWAFGESGDYSGGAIGGIEIRRFIIDSVKNEFYKKKEQNLTEAAGYMDEDIIRAKAREFENGFQAGLDALGFNNLMGCEVYKKPPAVFVDHDMNIRQFGEKTITFKLDADSYEIKLEDRFSEKDGEPWWTQSGFSVSIRKNNGPWKVLQADKTLWRHFFQYRIVYVSVSPSKTKIAIVVEAVQTGFEASKVVYYKGITGTMP